MLALGIPGWGENGGATGDLDVSGTITILGAGAHLTAVNAARVDRGGQAHDCAGILQSQTHNLISSFSGCTLAGRR